MEKMKYNISSRATILLGRESVSKVESALIELIKNTYDADATICYILFDVENDNILLIDNGSGMTKKIIEDNWMMIGTDNKKKEYISKKKRIKSGEKGIGRFALDRLGECVNCLQKVKRSMRLFDGKPIGIALKKREIYLRILRQNLNMLIYPYMNLYLRMPKVK